MEKIQKGIERALFYCLGLKKYERLLIITDDILGNLANLFYEVARKHQIDAAVLKIPAVGMDGSEPPAIVADALHHVDVALIITRYSMTHTRAREPELLVCPGLPGKCWLVPSWWITKN